MKKSVFIAGVGIALSVALGAGPSAASELVFGFNNPSFGGNPFIGQHLLSTANTINKHKAKKPPASAGSEAAEESDGTKEFEENLRRLVLNRLARTIVDSAFGEDGLQEGKHTIGDNTIEVVNGDVSISVTITNDRTGTSTTVTVPRF